MKDIKDMLWKLYNSPNSEIKDILKGRSTIYGLTENDIILILKTHIDQLIQNE